MTWAGELGADFSGLRAELCSYVLEFIASPAMKSLLDCYEAYNTRGIEGEDMLSGAYIQSLLFGLGLIAAVGVVQCNFQEKSLWHLSKRLNINHPLNMGLERLKMAKVFF